MDPANEKDAVLEAHAPNPAIFALLAVKPACITDAHFDRTELTLWIARDDIRPVCRTLQTSRLQLPRRCHLRRLVSQRTALSGYLPHPVPSSERARAALCSGR